ncbi:MAG: methyltransferase domain-containing protein [Acidimicrobiaceae bacterium]|nr:methyltransferase domain-containing protein [Acidimicrobiaceae bacterium]
MNYKDTLKKHFRKNGKTDFLSKLNSNSSILDVGCGNNSPFCTKQILPDCIYTGLDVGDYNQTKPLLADNYVITTPQNFSKEIAKFSKAFDAVISSHNLEHCDDREMTLTAMLEALKIGGKLYLSFPCEQSVNFPQRGGTLNYYDDSTHKLSPPNFNETLSYIKRKGFEIVYAERNYSPKILSLVGRACEPLSKLRNKNMTGTWEYYGFESIIIAEKIR